MRSRTWDVSIAIAKLAWSGDFPHLQKKECRCIVAPAEYWSAPASWGRPNEQHTNDCMGTPVELQMQ